MSETKRTYHRWTSREDNRVARLLKEGKSIKEIAKIMGIDERSIYNRQHRIKIYRGTTSKREYRYISDDERNEIVAMGMQGFSMAYISRQTGRIQNVIKGVLKMAGIANRYDR